MFTYGNHEVFDDSGYDNAMARFRMPLGEATEM